MTKKRIEALKYYAAILSTIIALLIFDALMLTYTERDLLEIFVLYLMFVYPVAVMVPFMIAGEDPEDDYEDDDDY
jgi:hypothetical protein